jgi:NosR/NirI family transcriptional regulator, nitrous oxide reductase regulator
MKKFFVGFTLLWIIILGCPLQATACNLVLNPTNFTTQSGEIISFHLERYKTHNVCVTPLEETKIIVVGGEVVDPGKWVVGIPDVLNFKVKFIKQGNATVRIERYCTKVGLMTVEARGTVSLANTSLVNPPAGTSEIPASPVTSNSNVDNATVPVANSDNQEVLAQTSILSKFISNITYDSLSLKLWYIFFIAGMILFLFKFQQLRKPFMLLSVVIIGFYLGGCPEPVGTPFMLLIGNSSLFKIALILLIIPVGISLIWGRGFCGWICPLGAVQELIFSEKGFQNLPDKVDNNLKWLKYLVLAAFLYLSWSTGRNIWAEYEPFKVLFNFEGTIPAIVILVITILLSIILERPFCRYICPFGAILTISSRFAPYKVRIDGNICKGCKSCSKNVCPVNAITMQDDKSKLPVIDNLECIKCLRCEDHCRFKALYIDTKIKQGSKEDKKVIEIVH